ncbi:MAG: sulfatase [Planctomycetaceae bacterium]|nr:sulfatase [Planctomycetaceae bacterium]
MYLSRRDMLQRGGTGLGMLGLASVLQQSGELVAATPASRATSPQQPRAPHFHPRAQRVVHLFMNGGPSQVDTFDPKPELTRLHGKPLPGRNLRTERKTGAAMGSPFRFRRRGDSGLPVSELFEQTGRHIDDICVIRSMQADVPNHEPSLMLMNCGDARLPRPSFGSWVTYGLGSENQDLPGFIVMCPGGYPIFETRNWRSAFLPGAYQGTHIDTKQTDVRKLITNISNSRMPLARQRLQIDLLGELNRRHKTRRPGDDRLEARIQSFELAFRMQTEATDAFDISKEPRHTQQAYGDTLHGRQLLMTRRLLERGVRFVQVWTGAGQPWDNHNNLEKEHRRLAGSWDGPIAAFLSDLKQRGLFDSTLVLWGGEFGRTPVAELPALNGRDHNHYGFNCWLAGGGVKGGHAHGATDDFGFRTVKDPVHVHDLHATMLHLLGFDHEQLTYRFAGRDFRLTDVHGTVVHELIG